MGTMAKYLLSLPSEAMAVPGSEWESAGRVPQRLTVFPDAAINQGMD
jgi:hypothetical protein